MMTHREKGVQGFWSDTGVKVGFSKINLEAALPRGFTQLEERIEAIACFIEEIGQRQKTVWLVLDFMDFDLYSVEVLQAAVREETGLKREQIHILTTHNHGGGIPDMEKLSALAAECVSEAIRTAQPAKMRYVFTTAEQQVSIVRRKYVPELKGVTTLFYGASVKEQFNAAPFVEHAIQSIREGCLSYSGREETFREFDSFETGDEEIFAIQFQEPDGTPIGTIARFAAHAVCSNLPGCHCSDYPWHVRHRLEEKLGGTAMFWNGPCGELAPGMERKGDPTKKYLGEYIADRAVSALVKKEFVDIHSFSDETQKISLPTRVEVKAVAEAPGAEAMFAEPEAEAMPAGMDDYKPDLLRSMQLPEMRVHLEKEYLKKQLSFLRSKALEAGRISDSITVSLGILRLNNLTIVGFPGETFSATGKALKAAFEGCDICTVTEHGRTVMYLPPLEEYKLGGYESVCMATAPGAEHILREEAIAALRKKIM